MGNINAKMGRYFENAAHKELNEFFFTSDGMAFKTEREAKGHAAQLGKQGKPTEVVAVARAEWEAWKQGGSTELTTGGPAEGEAAEESAAEAGIEEADQIPEGHIPVVVTQQMLDESADLSEKGIVVGQTIYIPKDDTQNTAEEIREDVKAAAKTKAVKTAAKGKATAKKTSDKKASDKKK